MSDRVDVERAKRLTDIVLNRWAEKGLSFRAEFAVDLCHWIATGSADCDHQGEEGCRFGLPTLRSSAEEAPSDRVVQLVDRVGV